MADPVTAFVKFAYTALTASGIKGFIARTIATIGLSLISSKLFAPKLQGSGIRGMQVTTRSALEYRKVVYGQAMVSGPIVYLNTEGTNNENLWYVIALSEGASDDLISVWFDGDEIPKADINWTAGTTSDGTGTGAVSTSKFVGDNSATAVNLFYYLGHDDNPVCGALDTAFADWTSTHRLRGVTYLVAKLVYDADTETVWEQGPPNDIKAVIKGVPVYDPRLDSTNGGTGAHRYNDETTWEWSENPALCVAHYLMQFMGVDPATSIDWTAVADAADDCEVTVNIPSAATEDRFTCNGVISLGASHRDNLDALLSSMDGRLSYTQGTWKVRASVWEASSETITADDIIGDVEVRGSSPRSERVNTVRGYFADPDREYQLAEFRHVTDASYVTRDNSETLSYDLELPFTNSEYMAQRIATRVLEQGDNQVVATLKLNKMGADIAIGDVVSVTLDELSWSSKTFRVISWSRTDDGGFQVVLREDQSSRYDDPAETDYLTKASGDVITEPAAVVPAPSSLTATAVPVGIKLDWTNPPAKTFDFIDIYEDTDDNWTGATKIASVKSDTYTVTHEAGNTYWYWIRARRNSGDQSNREPNSDTSTVTATTGPADGGCNLTNLSADTLVDTASTPNNATVGYRIDSDGDVYVKQNDGAAYASTETWIGSCANTSYECRLTVDSGDTPTGSATGSWLACSSDRTWELQQATVAGSKSNSCTIEIRRTSDSLVLASRTITMDVEVF